MTIIIKVDCKIGEESVYVSEISLNDLNLLNPLLLKIRDNSGYFPTGEFYTSEDPDPEFLYMGYPVRLLKTFLPSPVSGIKRILEISIFSDSPMTLYM